MGVTHLAIPYHEEMESEGFAKLYGSKVPKYPRFGRLPTWKEFQSVLEENIPDGYKIAYVYEGTPTFVYIDDLEEKSYLLRVMVFGLNENQDKFERFSFAGDREYLKTIIQLLPKECGTFLVVTNGENYEIIVTDGK